MKNYKNQVSLLLQVLPEVSKEKLFALHGGTAINLFIRNMPRLSVDIDLTYLPIEDRTNSFVNINSALDRIKSNIHTIDTRIQVEHKKDKLKLQITNARAGIKVEVNQGMRGIIDSTQIHTLCESAQIDFDAFCETSIVPIQQLFGGKICAALDRQHPRDLFDVKYLLENEGFTEEIKTGFIFCLLASKRPIHEMIAPNLIDQKAAFEKQFIGMTAEDFTYADFDKTRNKLIDTINNALSNKDKEFLISFQNTTPDWGIYNYENFPAVKWKLQNLIKLKEENSEKHLTHLNNLKELLK